VGIENPAEGKPELSAWRVRLRMRSMEMSGLMVMPKSMEKRSSSVRRLGDNLYAIHQDEVCEKADKKTTNHA